jgi:hypothetical protein
MKRFRYPMLFVTALVVMVAAVSFGYLGTLSTLTTKNAITIPIKAPAYVEYQADTGPTSYTAIPLRIKFATFARFSSNGESVYDVNPTYKYVSGGAGTFTDIPKNQNAIVFEKVSSAAKGSLRVFIK